MFIFYKFHNFIFHNIYFRTNIISVFGNADLESKLKKKKKTAYCKIQRSRKKRLILSFNRVLLNNRLAFQERLYKEY